MASTLKSALTEEVDRWKVQAQQELTSLTSQVSPYLNTAKALFDPKQRAELVESVTIETQIFPPVKLERPFVSRPPAPTPPAPPSSGVGTEVVKSLAQQAKEMLTLKNVGNLARPQLTLQIKGFPPMVAAPYGKPMAKHWETAITWGKYALLVVGGIIILRAVRKRRCVCSPI